jgi:hypothetical protein
MATCGAAADCLSGVCLYRTCQIPTCADGTQNQDESDVDCGGNCGASCLQGDTCGVDDDCASHNCVSETCERPTPTLSVQYHHEIDAPTDEWIRPILTINNSGSAAVLFAQLKIRYWYTIESPSAEELTCRGPTEICANLTGTFQSVSRPDADRVLELSFDSGAGSIDAGGSVSVELAFHKTDDSDYDEANDYSYEPQTLLPVDFARVTLYRSGLLVWGVEP